MELIWTYWHEEGLLVRAHAGDQPALPEQGAGPGGTPLAEFEITPLRPLNNLLWGYIQDEQHRLTPERRAYEYDHHYGLRTIGRRGRPGSGPPTAARASCEAFHKLLQKARAFFKEDDDTTVVADAFPCSTRCATCT